MSGLPRSASPNRMQDVAAATVVVIATLLVFWPVAHDPFVPYDDGVYVFENPPVLSGLTLAGVRWAFTTLHETNWHPLTWLSHMAARAERA